MCRARVEAHPRPMMLNEEFTRLQIEERANDLRSAGRWHFGRWTRSDRAGRRHHLRTRASR